MAQTVKNLPTMQKTQVRFLGWEDPLEKEMAKHSSTLTWGIPRTEEPGGLQSVGLQSIGLQSQTRLSEWHFHFSHVCSVQLLSHIQLFATPWTATPQSFLITSSWRLLKLMFIESVMPSNHLILCCPLLLSSIFPSIRVFSNESGLCIRWPKFWSFSISPSNEYSGLISFRISFLLAIWSDFLSPCYLISLLSKGLSKVFSNTTVQKHQFSRLSFPCSPTLTSMHTTGKTIALMRWTFFG